MNPFQSVVASGAPLNHMVRLAIIVKCAHLVSDIYAGCRVDHAFAGYVDNGVVGYLDGHSFNEAYGDSDDWTTLHLDALQVHAHDFLAQVELTIGKFPATPANCG